VEDLGNQETAAGMLDALRLEGVVNYRECDDNSTAVAHQPV